MAITAPSASIAALAARAQGARDSRSPISKKTEVREMCVSGKIKHKTRADAMIHIRRLQNKGMEPYRCRLCGNWHVANSRKDWKVQARIDQLLRGGQS
jgi:hypothetical protein